MKNIIKIFSLSIIALGFTSCLKDDITDDRMDIDPKKIVELPYQSHTLDHALNYSDKAEIVDLVAVRLAAAEPASEDVVVELSAADSQSKIGAYNKEHGTELVLLPTNLYTIPSGGLKVTIPKGSREAYFQISINSGQLDPSTTYAMAFNIASVSNAGYLVSGNFKDVFVTVAAKNKYDGVYTVTGTYSDLAAPANQAVYPKEIHLISRGANAVYYYDEKDLGSAGYLFNTGSGNSYYGNWAPVFNFDLATNAVATVTNFYGQGTNSSNRAGRIDPTGVNKFYIDAATSKPTIEVSYYMVQAGNDRIKVTEKFVFKEPRP